MPKERFMRWLEIVYLIIEDFLKAKRSCIVSGEIGKHSRSHCLGKWSRKSTNRDEISTESKWNLSKSWIKLWIAINIESMLRKGRLFSAFKALMMECWTVLDISQPSSPFSLSILSLFSLWMWIFNLLLLLNLIFPNGRINWTDFSVSHPSPSLELS